VRPARITMPRPTASLIIGPPPCAHAHCPPRSPRPPSVCADESRLSILVAACQRQVSDKSCTNPVFQVAASSASSNPSFTWFRTNPVFLPTKARPPPARRRVGSGEAGSGLRRGSRRQCRSESPRPRQVSLTSGCPHPLEECGGLSELSFTAPHTLLLTQNRSVQLISAKPLGPIKASFLSR
jgi:hypothetical protein